MEARGLVATLHLEPDAFGRPSHGESATGPGLGECVQRARQDRKNWVFSGHRERLRAREPPREPIGLLRK